MSSFDGAVTRMAGVCDEVFAEFRSVFGSEEAVMNEGHMGKSFERATVSNAEQLHSETHEGRFKNNNVYVLLF